MLRVYFFCREVIPFAVTVVATVVITRMITDGIERHELLLPLLNQQEVQRVVVITDNRKLFWPRAVETSLRVLINLRASPLVEDNFLKVMFFLLRA